jgi:glycosyltransferase involved in cell wall biosynthesis
VEEKKKILILSYYWPPSGGAGVQRVLKFAKYLLDYNYLPYIITVDDKTASYPVIDSSLLNEVPEEIKIFRTHSFEPLNILTGITGNKAPYGGFANKNKDTFSQKILRFIRGNFFIPDARKGWVNYAYAKSVELIKKEKIETIIISSPPHSSQLVGLKLKKKFPEIKWIADLRDPWTDIYYYRDMLHTAPAAAHDATLEKKVVEQADALIVVSKPILNNYFSKSDKISADKIHIIPNGYDEADFPNIDFPANEEFTITYVGTIADVYNPSVFFECLRLVRESNPDKKIKLRFVGASTENIFSLIKQNHLESITEFIPHVKHEQAITYMRSSEALLLVIPDVPDSHGILTGKLFEYLAARKPIICIGPAAGDAARIINECSAGETFERNEINRMADYLSELIKLRIDDKAIQNESRIFEKYSRKNLTDQLSRIIAGGLSSNPLQ